MINSPVPDDSEAATQAPEERIDEIVRRGPGGAIALAGTATAIVFALWFAFYFLVFLPRGVIH
ncbi:hypothetical protein B0G76_2594 [Paraburkholderia sp. BL23I1N1]|uniref:hypothetical protein n=1 Tax=Paraburkholderia sp. BL23I1N1 TaxID=1938802 RepID=UPI000E761265|nr:hypothetical protein [Paraburkholderia sp. BL23I1N1]RKE36414.1 hypothetical protein B0G76_2594 [Paraburkholderia sp. BL23I1N1]